MVKKQNKILHLFLLCLFAFTISYVYFLKPVKLLKGDESAAVIKQAQSDDYLAYVNFSIDEEETKEESAKDALDPVVLFTFFSSYPSAFLGTSFLNQVPDFHERLLRAGPPVFIRIHSLLI